MQNLSDIETDSELQALHNAGSGFIYNDYRGYSPLNGGGPSGNVLHTAACSTITRQNTKYRKIFFISFSSANEWLSKHRGLEGKGWKCCRCVTSQQEKSYSFLTHPVYGTGSTQPSTATKQPDPPKNALEEDIESILDNQDIEITEKLNLIKSRIGQGEFRRRVIAYWTRCSVTGCSDVDLLIASHIKPWREADNAERLNHFNGLLLTPNLDKAFDAGYITFDPGGQIQISPRLQNPQALGIHERMSIELTPDHDFFMSFHRNEIFIGE